MMVPVNIMELLSNVPRMTMKLKCTVGTMGVRLAANVFTVNVSLLFMLKSQNSLTSSSK